MRDRRSQHRRVEDDAVTGTKMGVDVGGGERQSSSPITHPGVHSAVVLTERATATTVTVTTIHERSIRARPAATRITSAGRQTRKYRYR